MRKVACIGNGDFPLDAGTGAQVVDTIRSWGPNVVVLTRGSAGFDQFVGAVCVALGIRCLTYKAHGGGDNIERDGELVRDADEVHGYLTLETFEQGVKSGTLMVIERALSVNKPTYAYTVVDGRIIGIGSPAQSETA